MPKAMDNCTQPITLDSASQRNPQSGSSVTLPALQMVMQQIGQVLESVPDSPSKALVAQLITTVLTAQQNNFSAGVENNQDQANGNGIGNAEDNLQANAYGLNANGNTTGVNTNNMAGDNLGSPVVTAINFVNSPIITLVVQAGAQVSSE